MTAQVEDGFLFNDEEYSFVAWSKPIRVHPNHYGIFPEMFATCCWRGFWCNYKINQSGIFLKDLYVNSLDDIYPKIHGIAACRDDDGGLASYMGCAVYKDLNIRIPYTGRLLVGNGYLKQYYIHMGYQKFWAYKELKELIFVFGKLIKVIDQSEIADRVRSYLEKKGLVGDCFFDISDLEEDVIKEVPGVKEWWL